MTDNEIENTPGAPAFRDQVETAVQSLRQEVERRLEESRSELQRLMDDFVENLPEPPAPPPPPAAAEPSLEVGSAQKGVATVGGPAMADLRDAIAELDEADNQAELMARLVEQASTFASRTVLLLDNQEQGLKSWASLGFGRAGTSLEGLEFPPSVEPAWVAARDSSQSLSGAQCSPLWDFIDVEQPMQGALIPLSVRGKVLAFLYADQTSPGNRFSIEALQLLAHSAAQKLDLLPLGGQGPSATLRLQSSDDGGLGLGGVVAAGAGVAAAAFGAVTAESPAQEGGFEPPPAPMTTEQVSEPAAGPSAFTSPAAAPESVPTPLVDQGEADAGYEDLVQTTERKVPLLETSAELEQPSASLDVETFDPVSDELDVGSDARLTPAERSAGFVLEELPGSEAEAAGADQVFMAPPEIEGSPFEEVSPEEGHSEPEHPTTPPPSFSAPAAEVPPTPASTPAPTPDPVFEPVGFKADLPSPPVFEPVAEPAGVEASLATRVITPDQIAALGTAGPAAASTSVAEPPVDLPELAPPELAPPELAPPEPTVPEPTVPEPTVPEPAPPEPVLDEVPQPSPSVSMSSSQVMPPADLEGPGLAFQETKAPGDDPAHEEAKRLARLLVSEIKLYNGEQIRAGKVAGNIYGQMRDDIDRSRQMYEERIDARVKESSNYFRDELVRTLAEGDESILGM